LYNISLSLSTRFLGLDLESTLDILLLVFSPETRDGEYGVKYTTPLVLDLRFTVMCPDVDIFTIKYFIL
jgi:hypothetical protein